MRFAFHLGRASVRWLAGGAQRRVKRPSNQPLLRLNAGCGNLAAGRGQMDLIALRLSLTGVERLGRRGTGA